VSQAEIHTDPDSHARAFDLCVAGRFSKQQAMVMANGFAARGHTDASEGCTSYVLHMMQARAQMNQGLTGATT